MKFVYGPVPSRRLGYSLGVSLVPPKTCNYGCVYCQLGPTTNYTNTRKNFYPLERIISSLKWAIYNSKTSIDAITMVGDGEPTLYADMGRLIRWIKMTFGSTHRVAVITNGSLLWRRDVRTDLKEADIVLPSLDAVNVAMYRKINHPHPDLSFDRLIKGIKNFTKNFKGVVWVEIMLLEGINDDEESIHRFAEIVEDIQPQRVYINVPIRPPTQPNIAIPSEERIKKAVSLIPNAIALDYIEEGGFDVSLYRSFEDAVLNISERHPLRMDQVGNIAGKMGVKDWTNILMDMELRGMVRSIEYDTGTYILRAIPPKSKRSPEGEKDEDNHNL